METTRIIYIHGGHSPPTQMQFTIHATRQLPQHPKDTTKIPQHTPKFPPQPARDHSLGKGHVHARSVFGPEHGAEQQQLPRLETETMLQHSPSLTTSVHHKATPLPQPARNHSFGKEHVHTSLVLGPEPGAKQQRQARQETKDLLARLRLLLDPSDTLPFTSSPAAPSPAPPAPVAA